MLFAVAELLIIIGDCYKLATRRAHLQLLMNFYSKRLVRHWNKSPQDVINSNRHYRTENGATKVSFEL